jgi:hypothetical protein
MFQTILSNKSSKSSLLKRLKGRRIRKKRKKRCRYLHQRLKGRGLGERGRNPRGVSQRRRASQ